MKQKLFVLSMDAMIYKDVAYLEQKPNFRRIMEKRAEVKDVLSVYPATTYPAHTTLMTGCYPGSHGIYSNFPSRTVPDGVVNWPLGSNWVFSEDIFAAAKRAGCSTAAVYWPITACNPNIDHVINEYFFYYPNEMADPETAFARQGADAVALQAVRENQHLLPSTRGSKELLRTSVFNDFIMGCTCWLIRNAQPDVLLVHNCLIDSVRHRYGAFSQQLNDAFDLTDEWLGDVIRAMEDAGVYEETNFVILSDHGQRDITKTVKINALLEREGLLQVAPDGTLYDWQAFAHSNGMSTTVHLIDNTNKKLYDRVYACLQRLQAEGKYGIEQIWTKEEVAERYGQGGPFSFMVEAEDGIQFSNAITGDIVTTSETPRGKHGYMPEKGPHPVFLANGPVFSHGATLENANLVDIAPTLAAALGQTMPEADGRVMTELLK